MGLYLYPVYTLCFFGLLIWGLRSFRESSFWGTSWLLFIMVAFAYSNLILSIGWWFGAGEILEVLSLLRDLLKVFLIPTFVFVSWDILRRIRVEWAEYLSARILFNIYTFLITVVAVYFEILSVTLEPIEMEGVLQYISSPYPIPWGFLLTMIPLFLAGIIVWQKLRWPFLLGGACGVFLLILISIMLNSFLLHSFTELLLILCLVFTEMKLRHEDFQENL